MWIAYNSIYCVKAIESNLMELVVGFVTVMDFDSVCNTDLCSMRLADEVKQMRPIDADKIFPWYVEAFSEEKIGEKAISPDEVRFSMNDIRENLDNIPTLNPINEDLNGWLEQYGLVLVTEEILEVMTEKLEGQVLCKANEAAALTKAQRRAVIDAVTKEYNRRREIEEDFNGLKLAWIEKAINSVTEVGHE